MSQFLTLEANDKTMKFCFVFVIRLCYEKLDHMPKPLVPKLHPDPSAPLKDIAEKQVPVKLKLIVVDDVTQ